MSGEFGFDPYLISNLQQQQAQTNNASQQNLADLLQKRAQTQAAQWQLGRQQNLANIVRQNAGQFQNPYAQSLAQGGFGQEAFDAQNNAPQLGQRILGIHRDLAVDQAAMVKTPEQAEKFIANVWPDVKSAWGFTGDEKGPEALAKVQSFRDSVNPEHEAKETGIPGQMIDFNKRTGSARPIVLPGGGASQLSGPALDAAAKQFNQTGDLPDIGTDPGGLLSKQIRNRAEELFPGANIAANKAAYAADKSSLESYQKQADSTTGFIRTLDKNIDAFDRARAKLSSSKYPALNKGMRWFQENSVGDPNLAQMKAALQTVNSEIAKINSGAQGGSPPLATLEEATRNLPPDATPDQIAGALQAYRQDSENRRDSMLEQIGAIKSRLGDQKPGSPSSGRTSTRSSKSTSKDAASHPQALDALKWARANRGKDPKADEILKRLGVP